MAKAKPQAAPAPEADQPVALVPLSDLYIHPLNARSEPPAADIEARADSIGDLGLLQNLAGFTDPALPADIDHKIGIVAGGRRLRALGLLCARDGRDPAETRVPVRVTANEETARLWASAENAAREALHPADEVRAYGRMAAAGAEPERIARAFAVTVRHVRQRLRLAQLPGPALDALRAGEITLDQAAALTAARDDEAALEALAAVAGKPGYYNSGPDAIRNRLAQASVSGTDRRVRYIGVDAYREAGGRVQEDLFTDATRLLDEDVVQHLFAEKLQAAAEAEKETKGWKWIEVTLEAWPDYNATRGLQHIEPVPLDLPEADIEEMEALSERGGYEELTPAEQERLEYLETRAIGNYAEEDVATSGLWFYVDGAGELCARGPFRRPEDDPNREREAEGGEEVTVAKPESAALSSSLVEDLNRIRLAALQVAIGDDFSVAYDLLEWHFSGEMGPWDRPLALSPTSQDICPDKTDGFDLPKRALAFDDAPANGRATAASFAAFRSRPSKDKGEMLARAIARCVIGHEGRDYLCALAAEIRPDVRRIWTPTASGYLSRLPVARLDRIWCDLVPDGLEPTHAKFRALKKGEKAQLLHKLFNDADFREGIGTSREVNETIDTWLPAELQWPEVETAEAQEAAE